MRTLTPTRYALTAFCCLSASACSNDEAAENALNGPSLSASDRSSARAESVRRPDEPQREFRRSNPSHGRRHRSIRQARLRS